jgi:hypothetical protein
MSRWMSRRSTFAAVTIGLSVLAPAAWADQPAIPSSGTLTWSINPDVGALPIGTPADASASRTATTEFGAYRLPSAVNTVYATLDATIPAGTKAVADVRGLRADGTWSEWVEITPDVVAALPESTRSVQSRLVRTVGSAPLIVRSIDLTAWNADRPASPRSLSSEAGNTYTVFATREGLVGGTTANGHVITPQDHFVALPSRRGLAAAGGGDYTARVCTLSGSRCEWAPVWDVGPWNTKDDYWNADRQSWTDLPQGKPQAQAAYVEGYNGGLDQFGRKVRNPAAIDLADGAFWDGLQLTGNAYVNVTFQWTGSGAWGTVGTTGQVLPVRTGPELSSAQAGMAVRGAQVRIECELTAESVDGPSGTSDRWYRLAPGKYAPAAHVEIGSAPSPC